MHALIETYLKDADGFLCKHAFGGDSRQNPSIVAVRAVFVLLGEHVEVAREHLSAWLTREPHHRCGKLKDMGLHHFIVALCTFIPSIAAWSLYIHLYALRKVSEIGKAENSKKITS
jgi:hypothetical protein